MRLGLGSYTFTWAIGVPGSLPSHPMGAVDLVEAAASLGVGVVQLCDNLPLVCLGPSELDRLHGRADELGVTVEVGMRGLETESLLGHLSLVRRFGGSFLRVVVDSGQFHPTPEQVVERLRPLLPAFSDASVRIAIENHDRFSAAALLRIIDELGPEHVGICLDTVNSFGALEGPGVVVAALAPHTLSLHVKDFTVSRMSHMMGFVLEGATAGSGQLDVPWLVDTLRRHGRDVNAILETWVTPADSLPETIERERRMTIDGVRNLRALIPD